ncbi:hypothetical protein IU438_23645 [Nocardia cyriacigeorgica]|uniref:hypothetical protein n=1 Tax=Nocardia cyriacigeorgica TaxID=135487 RepID=UPI001894205F|nr:hypothetical protein [Nocardia cyriacigeorgica]MBF6088628.1 hypothetical protein [Nocardia cyriacigeorgica]MBF6093221.1 hypothetical protein [Nocardia cyriacigeorgica]MBF6100206.1 hypothetical protein [Nocardia cyriacigeorgica]MBF6157371.1 hypothetical protein [Nocardia cyriacigeorgica]MBF6196342.1 hypothetical protein [Nocardia cyriacigeorgica]
MSLEAYPAVVPGFLVAPTAAKFLSVDDGLLLNVKAHPDFCAALRATPGREVVHGRK